METITNVIPRWNGLDGLINDKPFMPGASPARQAVTLMELAEQDGERLGGEERRLVIEYAEAVKDHRQILGFIYELCDSAHELQFGYPDPEMVEYVQREIDADRRRSFSACPPQFEKGGLHYGILLSA